MKTSPGQIERRMDETHNRQHGTERTESECYYCKGAGIRRQRAQPLRPLPARRVGHAARYASEPAVRCADQNANQCPRTREYCQSLPNQWHAKKNTRYITKESHGAKHEHPRPGRIRVHQSVFVRGVIARKHNQCREGQGHGQRRQQQSNTR